MSTGNRGHVVDQKPPLKPREVWSIRTLLQVFGEVRDLALFNLAVDSKLRACDLVSLHVGDVALSGAARDRGVIIQRKTEDPFNSKSPSRQGLQFRHGCLAAA